ncbi:LysR family transcriptional regulator [Ferrovibrio terrae]|uniref:LysR family transcriptional regulator n=1 Tax=Ferrovibrio terrae TaxID=2594003 RepID=UPI00313816A7
MDWDHLRVFLAIAREGQLLAAARKLGLNHATVSRRLDALEESVGSQLFVRRPAGSTLTTAGERLMEVVERLETEVLGIAEELRAVAAEVSGTVRIGAPDGLGNCFLAGELGALVAMHPGLTIELVPMPRIFSLTRREADLAIVLDQPADGRLVVSRLTDYSLSLYAARAYLDREGTPNNAEALADHVLVTGVEDMAYASALDYGALLDKAPGRKFRCASVVGQLEAVKAGTGIGILHDFAVGGDSGLVRILPKIAYRRSYYLLSHPEAASVRRITTCRDFLAKRFREERRRFLPED